MEMNHFGNHLPGGGYLGGHSWQGTSGFGSAGASVTQGVSLEYFAPLNQSNYQFGGMGGTAAFGQMAQLSLMARVMQSIFQFFGFGNGNASNNSGSIFNNGNASCNNGSIFNNGNVSCNSGSIFNNGNASCNNGSFPTWQPQINDGCQNQTGSPFTANSGCGSGEAWGGVRESLTWTRTLADGFGRSSNGVQRNSVETSNQGQTANMSTDKYKVDVAKHGMCVTVTNKETGKVQTYSGDPHAKESSGRNIDFKGNISVKLDDGNVLNIETSDQHGKPVKDGDKGPTYCNKVTLGNARQGFAKIENIAGSEPLKTSKLPFGETRPSENFVGSVIILDKNGNFVDPLDGKALTQADMNERDTMNKLLNKMRSGHTALFG